LRPTLGSPTLFGFFQGTPTNLVSL